MENKRISAKAIDAVQSLSEKYEKRLYEVAESLVEPDDEGVMRTQAIHIEQANKEVLKELYQETYGLKSFPIPDWVQKGVKFFK